MFPLGWVSGRWYSQPPGEEKQQVCILLRGDLRSAQCPSDADCVPPSVNRFAVVGDVLYAGDAGGRLFVVQNVENQLIERRGYDPVALGPPLAVCPPSPSGFGAVSDILSIP